MVEKREKIDWKVSEPDVRGDVRRGKGMTCRFHLAQQDSAACETVPAGYLAGDHKLKKMGVGRWFVWSGGRVHHTGINLVSGGCGRFLPSMGWLTGHVHN